jgi:4'-phosphopantetheinyl transferase
LIKYHPHLTNRLLGDEIGLWHINLLDLFKFDLTHTILPSDEREKGNRFYYQKHKDRYFAAHKALRLILSFYLKQPPSSLTFEVNAFGKPFLAISSLQFNLSHSGDYALVAVSLKSPVGCDIEIPSKRDFLGIAKYTFSKLEQSALIDLKDGALLSAFFRIWVQKEAFIKFKGMGLHYPLKQFSVSAFPGNSLLAIEDDDVLKYSLQVFRFSQGSIAAICSQSPKKKLKHFRFCLDGLQ